jgi:flagellar biosynthetic protein FlhB
MADDRDQAQERNEAPTPRRRDDARREGKVARSPELAAAAALLAGTVMLAGAGGAALGGYLHRTLVVGIEGLAGEMNLPRAVLWMRGVTGAFLLAFAPFALGCAAVAGAANLAQTRGAMSWAPLAPKLSHLSPLAGFRRILGPDGAVHLIQAVLKLAVLGLVAWTVLRGAWSRVLALAGAAPLTVVETLREVLVRLALATGLAFLAVALLDAAWRLFRHERSLRMSRHEVVREQRETEGNPMVKARLQALGRARARRRMLQQVPRADVVVVNPTRIAVALRYDVTVAPAPIVVAMGQRKLAQRIRDLARRHGVPVVENRAVARALLATATVGRAIPPALYAAIAEILAVVYRRRGRPAGLPAPAGGEA